MQHNDAEQQARPYNVNGPPPRTTAKPVYGNFQRYYHIRNPANSTGAHEQSESEALSNGFYGHTALELDSRIFAILKYISAHYIEDYPSAQTTDVEDVARARLAITVLDIGCNSGKLTIQLAQTLPELLRGILQQTTPCKLSCDGATVAQSSVVILGVDIDPTLITQAREAAAVARSLYRPPHLSSVQPGSGTNSAQATLYMPCLPADAAFFPAVFPSLFGSLPSPLERDAPPRRAKRQKKDTDGNCPTYSTSECATKYGDKSLLAPPRLHFLAAEWVDPRRRCSDNPFRYEPCTLAQLSSFDDCGYDIILALSLTKWIHIQQSDSGLVRFFARMSHTLRAGGLLFLECQEWRSYHSAKNMDLTIKPKIKALQLRPGGDFDWILDSFGLVLVETIGFGVGVGFARPLQVFEKASSGEGGFEKLVEQVLDGQRFDWVARSRASAS